jgi:hypothetical protein
VLTLDSIGDIYRPLIVMCPGSQGWLIMAYFVAYIFLVSVALMNLVTAVIVNGAFEQASQDRNAVAMHEEQARKRLVKQLRAVFVRLDENGSGTISRDEIWAVSPADMQVLRSLTQMTDPSEIFEELDLDGSGEVDIDEFCDGLWQVVVSKVSVEIRRTERRTKEIFKSIREMEKQQTLILKRVDSLCESRQISPRLAALAAPNPSGRVAGSHIARNRHHLPKKLGVCPLRMNRDRRMFNPRPILTSPWRSWVTVPSTALTSKEEKAVTLGLLVMSLSKLLQSQWKLMSPSRQGHQCGPRRLYPSSGCCELRARRLL